MSAAPTRKARCGAKGVQVIIGDFTEHQLANGLRLVLAPDHTAPVVALNLCYGVGSASEVSGRTGLAHLFEHLMFQGSANVEPAEHMRIVQTSGGSVNGYTSSDVTVYYETVPANYLELMLWLESDRMGGLLEALTQENLDNQRMVVKNEKRQTMDNRPYGSSSERLLKLVYPEGHPYHHHTIGSMDDLDAATLDDVRSFFTSWYGPDNCVITLAGSFDPDNALALVEAYFGPLAPRQAAPPPADRSALGAIGGETRQTVAEKVPAPAIFIGYRLPPAPAPELDALDVASAVLSAGRMSRLRRRLVRQDQLVQNASLRVDGRVAGASLGVASAVARQGASISETSTFSIEVIEKVLVSEIEALASEGPTELELARAKALGERGLLSALSRIGTRADAMSRYAMLFGDLSYLASELDRLHAVTTEQVRDAVAAYLHAGNRVAVTFVPGDGEEHR